MRKLLVILAVLAAFFQPVYATYVPTQSIVAPVMNVTRTTSNLSIWVKQGPNQVTKITFYPGLEMLDSCERIALASLSDHSKTFIVTGTISHEEPIDPMDHDPSEVPTKLVVFDTLKGCYISFPVTPPTF